MKVIAIANRKGGVCKTTVAVNLGAALALDGRRVLLLDMDSQGNASKILLDEPPVSPTIAHVLVGAASLRDVVRPSNRPGLDIAPASKELVGAQMALVDKAGRETVLRRALRQVTGYDVAIIDTGPEEALGKVNALVAATHVLMPFDPDDTAVEGMSTTTEALAELASAEVARPELLGCVQVKVDRRLDVTDEWREQVRGAYGPLLFDAVLRANSNFLLCAAWRRDIFKIEADKRPRRGCEDFRAIAAEVVRRLSERAARAVAA
jgi:chromosome partitioning protein